MCDVCVSSPTHAVLLSHPPPPLQKKYHPPILFNHPNTYTYTGDYGRLAHVPQPPPSQQQQDEEAISADSFRPRLVGSLMMTGAVFWHVYSIFESCWWLIIARCCRRCCCCRRLCRFSHMLITYARLHAPKTHHYQRQQKSNKNKNNQAPAYIQPHFFQHTSTTNKQQTKITMNKNNQAPASGSLARAGRTPRRWWSRRRGRRRGGRGRRG